MKIILKNLEDTRHFAAQFVKELKGGEVVILSGELGAGKTTFAQLLAEILGAKHQVNSPTFTLLQHYPTKNKVVRTIHHLDLYRLENEKELQALGLEELLGQPNTLTLIEWGEKYQDFFAPYNPNILQFSHGVNPSERIVEKK